MNSKKEEGNGKLSVDEVRELETFVHSPDSTDKAFKSQEAYNAIRMLILSDEKFMDNSMRYELPSNKVILAIAGYYQKCLKHDYMEGMEFIKLLCGLLTSRKGKRVDKLVEAIIGERKWKEGQGGGQGGGLSDKIKNFVTGNS